MFLVQQAKQPKLLLIYFDCVALQTAPHVQQASIDRPLKPKIWIFPLVMFFFL